MVLPTASGPTATKALLLTTPSPSARDSGYADPRDGKMTGKREETSTTAGTPADIQRDFGYVRADGKTRPNSPRHLDEKMWTTDQTKAGVSSPNVLPEL